MKRILAILFLIPTYLWPASLVVGPGKPYTTIAAGINAMLPLNEDLVVYFIVPTLQYATPGTIAPTAGWNGYKVQIVGMKSLPNVVAYGEDGKVLELDGEGKLAFSYDLVEGIDGVEGRFTGQQMSAYIKDRLGSTRVTLLEDGAVSEAQMYYSYGKEVSLKSSASKTREKFTGKEHDNDGIAGEAEVDLDYFGARYYDSDLGVWISPDPARQFHSPYLYAGNGTNPINSVDADGNEIKIEGLNSEGEGAFWAGIKEESIRNSEFGTVVNTLMASEYLLTIVFATEGDNGYVYDQSTPENVLGILGMMSGRQFYISPRGGTIFFNMYDKPRESVNGIVEGTAIINLAHELWHAYDGVSGKLWVGYNPMHWIENRPPGPNGIPKTELGAFGFENRFRKSMGVGERMRYQRK